MKRSLLFLLALLFALPASAAPTKLAQQGRLLDGDGAPLEGTHDMVFVFYDADTGGTALWTEERSADFEEGYYSITLGEQVPLDDLLFATESVWLELSIDGKTLTPRQEVVSVPYAMQATAAEHVEGGMVDAAEISVDGTVVIDAAGTWVGPTPAVGWGDLDDIPADIADGDQDDDTLAGLACAEGQLPKWDAASSLWVCGDDIDTTDPNTDKLVSLVCSTGQVAKWDGATWACGDDIDTDTTDPNTDTLQDLALTCFDGEIPSWDQSSGLWICSANTDTNTQLTDSQVAAAATAEGFVTGVHTVDTNTQLTDSQVAAAATAEGFVTGAHTVDTDTLATLSCAAAGDRVEWDGQAWTCVSPPNTGGSGVLQVCESAGGNCLGNFVASDGISQVDARFIYQSDSSGLLVDEVYVYSLERASYMFGLVQMGPTGTSYFHNNGCWPSIVYVPPNGVAYNATPRLARLSSSVGSRTYMSFRTSSGCVNAMGSVNAGILYAGGTGLRSYELRMQ